MSHLVVMRSVALLAWSLAFSGYSQSLVPAELCALDSAQNEASGLLMVEGSLWVVLDSGNPNTLFQVDPATCEVTRSLHVPNAVNSDWEELTTDGTWVYIGDFGNNGGNRTDLRVYRVPLAALLDEGVTEVLADSIRFAYPDQSDLTLAYDANNWDCEAFVARNDSLFLFSKNWLTSDCYLYAMPAFPGEHAAIRRDTLPSEGLVTGASLDTSTGVISLIGHSTDYTPFAWRLSGYPANSFFHGDAARHEVDIWPLQAEGICRISADSVLLCSEATGPLPARIWSLELPLTDAIAPLDRNVGLRVYPDPATDVLHIDSANVFDGGLHDETGRLVARWHAVEGITTVPVAHLPDGRYTLRSLVPPMSIEVVIAR